MYTRAEPSSSSLPASIPAKPALDTASTHRVARTALVPAHAITATIETRVAMPSNPAPVNVPLRLWREISNIAASHRTTIVKVNRGHKTYARTEVAGASMCRQVFECPLIGSVIPLRTLLDASVFGSIRGCFRGDPAHHCFGDSLPVDLV